MLLYLIVAFLLVALALLCARFLFTHAGIYLPKKVLKIILVINLLLLLMSASTFILANYNIYWRGYRSTSIIIIATGITGLLCFWLYKGNVFMVFPGFRSVLFTILLFAEIVCTVILVWDMHGSYSESLYYNDDTYRLENTDRFIMAHASIPDLFVKKGLFEKKYVLENSYPVYQLSVNQIKSTTIKELPGHQLRITFTHTADTSNGIKNPLIIDVDLNKEPIIK